MNLTVKQLILGSLLFIASAAQADSQESNGYLQNAWTTFKCLAGVQVATYVVRPASWYLMGISSLASYSSWYSKIASATNGSMPLRYRLPFMLANNAPALLKAARAAQMGGTGYCGYNLSKAAESNRVIEA